MKTLFSLCGTLSNKLSFIVVGIKMNITSFSMSRDFHGITIYILFRNFEKNGRKFQFSGPVSSDYCRKNGSNQFKLVSLITKI